MTHPIHLSRRNLLLTGGAALLAAGCSNAVGSDAAAQLDARVDQTNQEAPTSAAPKRPASAPRKA